MTRYPILWASVLGLSACTLPPPPGPGQPGYEGFIFSGQVRGARMITLDKQDPANSRRLLLDMVVRNVKYGELVPGQTVRVQMVPQQINEKFSGVCSVNSPKRNAAYPHGIYVIDAVISSCVS